MCQVKSISFPSQLSPPTSGCRHSLSPDESILLFHKAAARSMQMKAVKAPCAVLPLIKQRVSVNAVPSCEILG